MISYRRQKNHGKSRLHHGFLPAGAMVKYAGDSSKISGRQGILGQVDFLQALVHELQPQAIHFAGLKSPILDGCGTVPPQKLSSKETAFCSS
jgi:hypothetical protein